MYGRGNSGPAREVWRVGDRVREFYPALGVCYSGTVAQPEKDRNAAQTGFVWVKWDDGEAGWHDPNSLDVA